MTAEAMPFRTPISRQPADDQLVFSWSTDDPPVHARYRIEWKFRVPDSDQTAKAEPVSPAETMCQLGIFQEGDPVLAGVARPFDLPAEAEDARRVTSLLAGTLERVGQAHNFSKGMGLAAPQIGIGRAAAMIRAPGGETITLLNPRVTDQTAATDEQYEGCLSFFDVRGMVPRLMGIEVEHQDVDGTVKITTFERGLARLVCHETDHLFGVPYRSRMRAGVEPIPAAQSVRAAPGGKALNQAVALARAGARVCAVGVVGGDGVGRDILATLARPALTAAASTSATACPRPCASASWETTARTLSSGISTTTSP
jgi:peptide deformylase